MPSDGPLPTRKEFLLAVAGVGASLAVPPMRAEASRKLLIVAAHPDDEYSFAATVYRLVRESGWAADQVVITDGEAGYRYSALAEAYYGVALARESDGRAHLPAIRQQEAIRAGQVLGIRRHYFLDQKDLGFDTDAAAADSGNWDRKRVLSVLSDCLTRERYDAVFTLLPTAGTHGHHRAATLLALEAVSHLAEDDRPLVFGVEPHSRQDAAAVHFAGLAGEPLTATASAEPVFTFDRATPFGLLNALNYQIVVNWVIAEHKSQGLFQMVSGAHELEQFWLFAISGKDGQERIRRLRTELSPGLETTAAR
jgi:LmbE family N-acetylglucosaminyl deacetylase